jgi:hypothetical protein
MLRKFNLNIKFFSYLFLIKTFRKCFDPLPDGAIQKLQKLLIVTIDEKTIYLVHGIFIIHGIYLIHGLLHYLKLFTAPSIYKRTPYFYNIDNIKINSFIFQLHL